METDKDGLVEVTLGREWEGHAAGETFRVDPVRAVAMEEEGALDKPKGERAEENRVDAPAESPRRQRSRPKVEAPLEVGEDGPEVTNA